MNTFSAIFLDKDGTLIEDVPYNVAPEDIRVYPDAVPSLAVLTKWGYRLFVISNQPGVAHGFFDCAAVEHAGDALLKMLRDSGVPVSGFYYCPHYPRGEIQEYSIPCECRKPMPGLLQRAARDHNIDLASSWMVGDILNDVEAGKRAGCRAILVDRGNETEWVRGKWREPDATVSDLSGLLRHIGPPSYEQLSGT